MEAERRAYHRMFIVGLNLNVIMPAHAAMPARLAATVRRLIQKCTATSSIQAEFHEGRQVHATLVSREVFAITVVRDIPMAARVENAVARFGLTQRERDVLLLALDGLRTREIAARLQIARPTVDAHIYKIIMKTGARSRTHMVAVALGWDGSREDLDSQSRLPTAIGRDAGRFRNPRP